MNGFKRSELIKNITTSLSAELSALSDAIWAHPETAFKEKYACKALSKFLLQKGFSIECPAGGLNTAFVASWGSGFPKIGFLGEYDALPGLGPITETEKFGKTTATDVGHGCGHNLLGAGAAGAAVALCRYLEANRLPGTVQFFGCPAEESGAGKEILVQSGAFSNTDACFTWHPETRNCVVTQQTLANILAEVTFYGRSSHAASSPELGRSALDACELMNVGANYLREHVSTDVRFHYAYTDAGGTSPNIVPNKASLLYYVRAKSLSTAEKTLDRLFGVAKGAALMTETEVAFHRVSSMSEYLPNETLGMLTDTVFQSFGAPAFTQEEEMEAAQFSADVPPLSAEVEPFHARIDVLPISTDVGNVSHVVPTAQIYVACFAKGTPFHDNRLTTQAILPAAHRGMITAAAVLATAAASIIESPEILSKASAELRVKKEA